MIFPARGKTDWRRAGRLAALALGLCGCQAPRFAPTPLPPNAAAPIAVAAPRGPTDLSVSPPPAVGFVILAPVAGESLAPVDMGLRRASAGIVVSATPEQDCNIFRLAVGESFCKPVEPAPSRPEFCTRSLAKVDCWESRNPFGVYQRGVADGPWRLTKEQEFDRTGRAPAPDAEAGSRDEPAIFPDPPIIQR